MREHGSHAVLNQVLKMVRDCQPETGVLDECYRRGLENAPVFKNLPGLAPRTLGEFAHP